LRFARLLGVVLLVATPAYAQESTAITPAKQLPPDVALQFEQRIADIDVSRDTVAQLSASLSAVTGLEAELYRRRMDTMWAVMFDDTVKLARDVVAKQAQGFDVAAFVVRIAPELRKFPDESTATIERLRKDLFYTSEEMLPAETAIWDQRLLRAARKVDSVFQSLISYVAVAGAMGIDEDFNTDYLARAVQESAAFRSAFLHLADENAAVMRAAAAALPADTDVAARLSAAEARVRIASAALQSSVNLMRQLDLDARKYSQQVVTTTGNLTSDVLDFGLIKSLVTDWSSLVAKRAKLDGPSLLFKLIIVLVVLVVFTYLGRIARSLTKRALRSSKVSMSALLTDMIVATAGNLMLLLGIFIALAQVGISVGPLLAGLGIAGFIVGFALQDSLSNFASGMLILIYRPFDVGDFVTAAGVTGTVSHMTLVNTTFTTIDNQLLVIPNNLIWSSAITNVTAQRIRRIDLVFGVSYADDVQKVERVLTEIVTSHAKVLARPEPVVKLHQLADSSVNFVVRPWVKTDDYWETYWDITRSVKLRFDAEGITIPFPQRQLHYE